jgi:hypothetical protein
VSPTRRRRNRRAGGDPRYMVSRRAMGVAPDGAAPPHPQNRRRGSRRRPHDNAPAAPAPASFGGVAAHAGLRGEQRGVGGRRAGVGAVAGHREQHGRAGRDGGARGRLDDHPARQPRPLSAGLRSARAVDRADADDRPARARAPGPRLRHGNRGGGADAGVQRDARPAGGGAPAERPQRPQRAGGRAAPRSAGAPRRDRAEPDGRRAPARARRARGAGRSSGRAGGGS